MKKKFLFLMALLAVSLFALAEMTVYVYQKDGTKDEYLAANVDSIGFFNVFTITFDANGGDGSMEVIKVKEGETITLPANTLTKGSSTFAGWNTQADGTGTAYADKASVSIVASQTLYAQWDAPKDTGIADGHEWVDLGLPSGTKWATCNLGASSPEETGYYIAWGETSPKAVYNLSTYKWYDDTFKTMTDKYSFEDILEESDDAASVRWGISWRMPTTAEIYELRNTSYTTWTWTTQNGVQGYKVTSKTNGNSIFLPAAGYRSGSVLGGAGSDGRYWSNKVANSTIADAYCLWFNCNKVDSERLNRYYGYSVRPVMRVVTYEVILDSNGGEGTMQPITINYNEIFTVPSNKYTRSGYSFFCWNDKADGSGRNYKVGEKFSLDSDIILYAQWYKKDTDTNHEWVDLGLPSGTKWATCNLGASSPEETGYYIAWGETSPKAVYNLSTYRWYDDTFKTITSKYSFEDILEESDDAASVRWGISWRMPTTAEIYELRNTSYTTWTWTTQNGVQGYKVTSKTNGNSIFLPAAGLRDGSYLGNAGSVGCYWSNKVANNTIANAYYLRFNCDEVDSERSNRYYGFSVRPVMRVVTYEVILDSNGGEGTMQPITINYNEIFTVPSNKYTRSGYSFFCWNDKADGSGRNYEVGEKFSLDSDIILYAQWY